jgi:nickel/cobalt transporter (NicO) family protein
MRKPANQELATNGSESPVPNPISQIRNPQSAIRNFFIATGITLCIFSSLTAHVVTRGAGTAALVTILDEKLFITFDLSFAADWCRAEMVKMDTDRNAAVSEAEAEAYMVRAWEEKLAPALSVSIDGAALTLKRTSMREANLVGDVRAEPAEIYYEVEAELPPTLSRGPGQHLLVATNDALKDETPEQPVWYMPLAQESYAEGLKFAINEPTALFDLLGPADVYTMVGRRLVVSFNFQGGSSPPAGTTSPAPAAFPRRAGPPPEKAPAEDRFFEGAVQKSGTLDFGSQVLLALLAMAYGAAHALAPGHGKTMMAAYLVGTRGRIGDAVVLGLSTTFAHIITVLIAGVGINLALAAGTAASTEALQNRIVVATKLLSGLLLFAMGIGLFWRRWRYAGDPGGMAHHHHHHHPGGHHHHHDHPHQDHDHDHDHVHPHSHPHPQASSAGGSPPAAPPARPGFWTLFGLGASGGLVPCPAGIVVILTGLHYQRLLFSLLLLVFFSLALGAVLVLLGILVVTGKKLLPFRPSPRVTSYLPAFSALFIAALGTFFTVQSFQEGRTEIAALLDSLSRLIGPR